MQNKFMTGILISQISSLSWLELNENFAFINESFPDVNIFCKVSSVHQRAMVWKYIALLKWYSDETLLCSFKMH